MPLVYCNVFIFEVSIPIDEEEQDRNDSVFIVRCLAAEYDYSHIDNHPGRYEQESALLSVSHWFDDYATYPVEPEDFMAAICDWFTAEEILAMEPEELVDRGIGWTDYFYKFCSIL